MRAIYGERFDSGNSTFQTEAPAWEEWDWGHLAHSRLVAVAADHPGPGPVLGWAALTPRSARGVYAGVAEVSLYVAGAARGRGVARQLLDALVAESEAYGVWTLLASIFPENTTSLSIYAGAGFREVGRCERIGQLHGVWRDIVLLERRSAKVGLPATTA
ncbi:N-acetyltransferase [Hymenobacter sp. BT683]|uniref:N-acetyltransferase n=2 Tax=Hymenobacter jeongseonensis TaxID=2791027 RepID=A0ABS0ILU7_9BACT|nr:N-acetyltransferase [Hymenobacter jeongseonensis]